MLNSSNWPISGLNPLSLKIQLAAIDNDLAMPASLDFGLQALNERFSGIVVDGVVSVDDTDFPVGGVRLSVHECRL